jgi:uncharacterized protein
MSNFTARPGDFCWFELATTDQAAAKQFYEALFGWASNDMPIGPSETYTIFRLGGRDVAAAHTLQPVQQTQGIPPNWLVYVRVEDVDTTASRAPSLGGAVVAPPFDVGETGRMSVISDPAGAVFALWQAGKHAGVGVNDEVGSVGWADLQVRDQDTAGEFYSDLFGWKMVGGRSMHPAKPGEYFHIMNGESMIGGIPPSGQVDPKAHPAWLIYIEVADCALATKKAVSLGGRAYVDTMEIGQEGRISVIADPQGAVFALHQAQRRTP